MAQLMTFANFLQNIQIPADIKPLIISLPPPPKLEGPLAPNSLLSKVRTHANGKVLGPDSMVIYKGYVYTGQADGWVVEISPKESVRRIARMSLKTCGKRDAEEGACGRPMGIRLDKDGFLVVADAYNGIIRVNPRTGERKWLVYSRNLRVNGQPVGYLNDLTIARDGKIFFTTSSSRWSPAKESNILFEADNTGRVLMYDPQEKKAEDQVKELITNLAFPKGIQLSKDEDYLLIAEGSRCRIMRAWIGPNSPKRNTIEEFSANLPGIVDKVRLSPRGTFWVGVSQARHHRLPTVLDKFGNQPKLRALLIMLVNNRVKFSNPRYGIVLELDSEGRVVRTLQDPVGWRFNSVSEVEEEHGILYFASPAKKSIGFALLKWLPIGSNVTSILHHPQVLDFIDSVQNNMLKMTDKGIRDALVSLIQEILVARQRLITYNNLIIQRQTTVNRLRKMLQESEGGPGTETTTCGNCGGSQVVTTTTTPMPPTTSTVSHSSGVSGTGG